MQHRRRFLLTLCVLLALVGVPVWVIARQVQQERLDAALRSAIKANETHTALALLERGADPNIRELPRDTRSLWQRALELFRPQPPATSDLAWTPLAYLTLNLYPHRKQENTALLEALLRFGADPNLPFHNPTKMYSTPLIESIRMDSPAYVRLLVQYGADVNLCSEWRVTPLMWSVGASPGSTPTLLEGGAEVNARDFDGTTALIYAARRPQSAATLKQLLQKGADPHLRNFGGNSALDMAHKVENLALLKQVTAKP